MRFQPESYSSTPRTLFGLAAVVLLAVGVLPTLYAQTTLKAKIALRALTRDDIAAHKLPSTTQSSGGLATVGIGQPVHLELLIDSKVPAADVTSVTWTLTRQPAGSKAVVEDSPLPESVPTFERADRIEYQLGARKFLRPDVGGVYMLNASVQTKSGTVTLGQLITAGTYVGAAQCFTCHSGGASQPWSMGTSWAKTNHAQIFKEGMEGVASDHYGEGCLACHTVGYDKNPLAVNGGFDDVAKELNWTFPKVLKAGTFDALPEKLKQVGNIQCENCHGPGSRHVSSGGDPRLISISFESGVCAQCHAALTHHVKNGEWNNAGHAVTTSYPSGPGRESCVGCHTGTGFIDRVDGAKTIRTAYTPINCQTCHEPHGETKPGEGHNLLRTVEMVTLQDGSTITNGGKGTLCMNCHQSRQNAAVYVENTAASARFGPHHSPQADMLAGKNGYTYGKRIPSSAHGAVVEDTCVSCHMQEVHTPDPALTHAGGHTFKIRAEAGSDGKPVELLAACQKCHGPGVDSVQFGLLDYDNDGEVEGVQTEVQHLLDKLSSMLPPVGKTKSALTIDATWTRPQLKAAYNWQFVAYDGSMGVHNMAYAVGLIKASIADLEKNAPTPK